MAQYDEDTRQFMEQVQHREPSKSERTLRKGVSIANAVVAGRSLPSIATKEVVRALVKEGEAYATALRIYGILNDRFDHDWHDWEPETLVFMLQDVIPPTALNQDRLGALQTVLKTNFAFEHWHVFEKVGHALAGSHVDFGTLQPLEPDECALTVKLLSTLRHTEAFDLEVLTYIAACAHHAGMAYLPEDLFPAGCQEQLEKLVGPHFNVVLKDNTQAGWRNQVASSDDSAIGIQLAKLEEIKAFVSKGMDYV